MNGKIKSKIKKLKVYNKPKVCAILAGTLVLSTLISIRICNICKEIERHTSEDGILDEYYFSTSGRRIWDAREYTLLDENEKSSSLYSGIDLSELKIYEWGAKTEDSVSWYYNLTGVEIDSSKKESYDIPESQEASDNSFEEIRIPVYAFKTYSETKFNNEKIIRGVDGDSYSIKTEEVLGPDGCYYLVFPDYIRMEDGSVKKVAGSAQVNLEKILDTYTYEEESRYKKTKYKMIN